jgi:hypothetical protein
MGHVLRNIRLSRGNEWVRTQDEPVVSCTRGDLSVRRRRCYSKGVTVLARGRRVRSRDERLDGHGEHEHQRFVQTATILALDRDDAITSPATVTPRDLERGPKASDTGAPVVVRLRRDDADHADVRASAGDEQWPPRVGLDSASDFLARDATLGAASPLPDQEGAPVSLGASGGRKREQEGYPRDPR